MTLTANSSANPFFLLDMSSMYNASWLTEIGLSSGSSFPYICRSSFPYIWGSSFPYICLSYIGNWGTGCPKMVIPRFSTALAVFILPIWDSVWLVKLESFFGNLLCSEKSSSLESLVTCEWNSVSTTARLSSPVRRNHHRTFDWILMIPIVRRRISLFQQGMHSSDELFQRSREGYFGVYIPSCEATREINTKITLEWAQKQFVTRVHTSFYLLHDKTNPYMTIETTIFTHRPRVSLARFPFCWWRHN